MQPAACKAAGVPFLRERCVSTKMFEPAVPGKKLVSRLPLFPSGRGTGRFPSGGREN